MNKGKPTISVIGAGAIGGYTAARIAQAGWDVELVCKNPEILNRINGHGLHTYGRKGEQTVKLEAVRDVSDLSCKKDIVLLATKATEVLKAALELMPFIKESSSVVSLQNGMCEDSLAKVLGEKRIVGCVVGWGSTMHGPGDIEMVKGGEFVIGYMNRSPDERLNLIAKILAEVVDTRISDKILDELFSKLVLNCCTNFLPVITGLNLNSLFKHRKARRIFIGIMKESIAVAEAMGILVPPFGGGKLDYYQLIKSDSLAASLKRYLMLRMIGISSRKIKVSSVQSIERGRKTEIDFLNGYISKMGRSLGVPVPLNDTIVTTVKEIESGRRGITVENLNCIDWGV